MEPLLELATEITTQIWMLHALDPNQQDLSKLFQGPWREHLEDQARHDYSRLQEMLDTSGESKPNDWDPDDPWREHKFTGMQPQEFRWRAPRQYVRTLLANRNFLKAMTKGSRQESVLQAGLDKIEERVNKLLNTNLVARVDLLPNWQTKEPKRKPLWRSLAAPSVLTREDLFEKVARWLLSSPPGLAEELAPLFLRKDDNKTEEMPQFLMQKEIDERANKAKGKETKSATLTRWLSGQAGKTQILVNRGDLRVLCRDLSVPVPFSMVLSDELDEIARSRAVRLFGLDLPKRELAEQGTEGEAEPRKPDDKELATVTGVCAEPGPPECQAFRSCLFGLALSGGGIRSATFALGLLQGMADRNILPYIDVLSTVSGGGYIGSWFISWIKRRGGVGSVQGSLRGSASHLRLGPECPDRHRTTAAPDPAGPLEFVTRNTDPHADHIRPIRLLRDYARYLAPQAGLVSADSWTIATTWFRNTFLNFVILILLFGAVLLLPRVAVFVLLHLRVFAGLTPTWRDAGIALAVASIPILWGCWRIGSKNIRTFGPYPRPANQVARGYNDGEVVSQIIIPMLIGAFLEVTVLWNFRDVPHFPLIVGVGFGFVVFLSTLILWKFTRTWKTEDALPFGRRIEETVVPIIATILSIAAGCALIVWLASEFDVFAANTERGLWIAASLGLALMMGIIGLVLVLFLGLAGRLLSDEQREWWSRSGAWFCLIVSIWLVACAICFFMPLWIAKLGLAMTAAGLGWVSLTTWGAKLAFSAKSGRSEPESGYKWFNRLVMNLAPAVFVLGLLSGVAFLLFWGVQWFVNLSPSLVDDPTSHGLCCTNLPPSFQRTVDNYWALLYPGSLAPTILMVFLAGACILLAWRVDINEFSMHHFYKNRLVRAYLGASRSRSHRFPNAFTGFDLEDDIRLSRFQSLDESQWRDMARDCKASYAGPFPIINTALNITKGADLGLQERKAESFIFTPLWSGFDFSRRQTAVRQTYLSEYAFQRTERFGEPENKGVFLGAAMAISGAAFNSNAGFHTSPSLAFLLTIFGVRLGWWAGNPRGSKWSTPSPWLGLLYLVSELTANTSTNSNFVLLSDGGHFENMGLYELIRRRCRYIILSDAEEDQKFKLEGIGGAIRKCRDDFGVVIDLNIEALEPIGDPGVSHLHYSLGTIVYPGEAECGKLVYIKSSVTGDEPVDIIEFRKRHTEFPHTSTVNQFFDESHFESYRALGHHVASGVFTKDMDPLPLEAGADVCKKVGTLFEWIELDWAKRLQEFPKDPKEALRSVREPPEGKGETSS